MHTHNKERNETWGTAGHAYPSGHHASLCSTVPCRAKLTDKGASGACTHAGKPTQRGYILCTRRRSYGSSACDSGAVATVPLGRRVSQQLACRRSTHRWHTPAPNPHPASAVQRGTAQELIGRGANGMGSGTGMSPTRGYTTICHVLCSTAVCRTQSIEHRATNLGW